MKKEPEETIQEPPEPLAKEGINDELDLFKHAIEVHSQPKRDITSDFVLTFLEEQDKTGIIEMTTNASYSTMLIDKIMNEGYKWEWKNKEWKKRGLDNEEKTELEKIRENIYKTYMMSIYMTVILNRNKNTNFIMQLLGKMRTESEDKEEQEEMLEKIKKIAKPENKKEKE